MPSFAEARLADIRPIRWMGRLVEGIARVLGEAQDAEVALLKAGVSMRVPGFCPDDGIYALAANFRIEPFVGEQPGQLRARLVEAFPTWEEAGLPQAIIRSLLAYGVLGVQVYNYADWPTPDQWFSKFYVVVQPGALWAPLLWGDWNWGDATWGSTASPQTIMAVLRQVLKWKSPQSLPVAVISDFGGGPWASGNWGDPSSWPDGTIAWPLANLWGAPWCVWGAFNWGTGKWGNGEW